MEMFISFGEDGWDALSRGCVTALTAPTAGGSLLAGSGSCRATYMEATCDAPRRSVSHAVPDSVSPAADAGAGAAASGVGRGRG